MKKYVLSLEFLSDALIGSGEGYGAVIDSDIVFDDLGLPFVPAKRVKGCLRASTTEVCQMLERSGWNDLIPERPEAGLARLGLRDIVDRLFGYPGQAEPAPLYISDLRLEGYDGIRRTIEHFRRDYPELFLPQAVLGTFTSIRRQTAIDPGTGTARTHSLRTARVLNKGKRFLGDIGLDISPGDVWLETAESLLYLGCLNFRAMGKSRNRGLGEVRCKLSGVEEGTANRLWATLASEGGMS